MVAKSFTSFTLAFLGAAALIAKAQPAPTPPPPTAPFVATPQKNTMWSIKVTREDDLKEAKSGEPAQNDPRVKNRELLEEIAVQKDDKVTRIVASYTTGNKQEGYLVQDHFAVRSTVNSNEAVVMEAAKGKNGSMEIFTTDFQGTQWIDLPYYQGVEKLGETLCYVFARQPNKAEPPEENAGPNAAPPLSFMPLNFMPLKAYIDAKTKIPVRVQLGPTTYDYSPIAPLGGTISLPASFVEAAREYTRQMEILQRLKSKQSNGG